MTVKKFIIIGENPVPEKTVRIIINRLKKLESHILSNITYSQIVLPENYTKIDLDNLDQDLSEFILEYRKLSSKVSSLLKRHKISHNDIYQYLIKEFIVVGERLVSPRTLTKILNSLNKLESHILSNITYLHIVLPENYSKLDKKNLHQNLIDFLQEFRKLWYKVNSLLKRYKISHNDIYRYYEKNKIFK